MKQIKPIPSRNSSWLVWILFIVIIIAIIVFFNRRKEQKGLNAAAGDTNTLESEINNNWSGIDPKTPTSQFEELKDTSLKVRATGNYAIYSLKEAVLFEPGKYSVNQEASEKLRQIAASAEKRFAGGPIRIYGYADTTGAKEVNEQLAARRAEAVKSWLIENTNIKPERISFYSKGEANPFTKASGPVELQQHRRVEIIILKPSRS